MKIHIHVGVHKTATTFMQGRLKHNLARLNAAGVGFMPTKVFRAKFSEHIARLDREKFRIEDHLADYFPHGVPDEVRGIVMSDENLLGGCGQLVATGRLYDGVMRRMTHLRQLLDGHEVTLFCGVRRYDQFLTSAYCEGLRGRLPFHDFRDFLKVLEIQRVSWPRLLRKIERTLRPAHMRYWRYEAFKPNAEAVMAELAFGQALEPAGEDSKGSVYPSFSHSAVEALESVAGRLGPAVAGELVLPISGTLSKDKGYAEFDPWDDEAKARFAARYDADCRRIAPEKWLLRPALGETADAVRLLVA